MIRGFITTLTLLFGFVSATGYYTGESGDFIRNLCNMHSDPIVVGLTPHQTYSRDEGIATYLGTVKVGEQLSNLGSKWFLYDDSKKPKFTIDLGAAELVYYGFGGCSLVVRDGRLAVIPAIAYPAYNTSKGHIPAMKTEEIQLLLFPKEDLRKTLSELIGSASTGIITHWEPIIWATDAFAGKKIQRFSGIYGLNGDQAVNALSVNPTESLKSELSLFGSAKLYSFFTEGEPTQIGTVSVNPLKKQEGELELTFLLNNAVTPPGLALGLEILTGRNTDDLSETLLTLSFQKLFPDVTNPSVKSILINMLSQKLLSDQVGYVVHVDALKRAVTETVDAINAAIRG